ncbi:hypothetical protein CHS0354_015062 [Potamilus streckersoni]|uniref:Uncharacterized protein n=1 Tax=Potamilus streckersoni TaxID=2493646 RepID=A0AAE0WDZ2_9BIVA|nr:hypothetical protein CHS0354_015062 [Potamilus streckersoni]
MNRKIETYCSQQCSGDENLMCGGNRSDIVSVYRDNYMHYLNDLIISAILTNVLELQFQNRKYKNKSTKHS